MSVNRHNVHIRFTKHLLPDSAGNLNRLWNGITIEFKNLEQRSYLEQVANWWAGCKKLSEMSLEEYKELYEGKFRTDAQYQEALDFMGHLCTLIEATTGKTTTQLSNIALGKVENEIKKEMTLSEFQDIYRSLDSGSEELDALAERVFAVAGQIDGLTFKMADGRVFSGHNVMAHYAPGKNAIELNSDVFNSIRTSDAQKAQCLLHETIHAVTCWALARYKSASAEQRKAMGPIADACKDIEDVFKAINNDAFRAELQAKSKLTDNAMYGLTDEYEMLAEMANPAFRTALKAKRLWRQLVNGIKKLFGIDVLETGEEGTTAFEILNRAIDTILDNFDPEAYASYKNNPHKNEHEMRNLFDEPESTESRNWVQRSLFGEATATSSSEQKNMTPEEKSESTIAENRAEKESQERTDEVNARIDEFTDNLSDIYGRYLNIETEDEEKQALIEERMNDLISEELLRLNGHLEEYYLVEGNTTEDAHRMARDMASRVLAEATLKLAPEESRKVWNQWNEPNETSDSNTLITAGGETVDFTSATSTGILPDTPNGFRKLEPGEFCHVERKFTETKEFGFTGAEKIESIDDVAYIFRSLEDYSIENTFVVLVNGGRGTIVHVGMGGPTMSPVDMAAIRGAVDAYGAETLYFVHNHPSGNLRPSPADRAIQQKLISMFGEGRVPDGIIIDVTSGRYSTFGETHGSQTFDKHSSAGRESDSAEKIYPVIRQDKAVRTEEGKQVEQLSIIRSSEDVATFVSEKRLGSGSKINYLLLAQDNSVVGNLHTGFDSYGENSEALADEIVKMATRHGARRVVVYGNVEMQPRELRKLNDNLKRLSGSFVELCDALNIQSRTDYQSAIDMGYAMESDSGMMSPDGEGLQNTNEHFNEESKAEEVTETEGVEDGMRFRFAEDAADFDAMRERAVAERGIVMPNLNEKEVRVVEVSRHDFNGTGKEALTKAEKWAKENITGVFTGTDSEGRIFEYYISKDAVEKYVSKSATSKSTNIGVHLAVLKKLPEVISSSIETEVHADYTKSANGVRAAENKIGDKLVHRLFGAVIIDGKLYRVKTTIQETKEAKNKPHSYEVTAVELIEEPAGQMAGRKGTDTFHPRYSENLSETDSSGRILMLPVAKLLKDVEKSYDPGIKLLDASAETSLESAGEAENVDSENLWRLPWGKVQKWRKRRMKAAERLRNSMREKVRSLTKSCGIEVEIIEDASGLEGKKRTAKGWFDPRTGKIVIILGNHSSIADVEATLLHEMVAHKGLRDLFGDKFDAFLDAVWANASDEVKERISQLAARNGWNRRIATEEYMAGLAEDGSFKNVKARWWQKLKGLFMDFLRSCGFSGNRKISDNELRYVLWMSYENLRQPGRFKGILGTAARVAKEHELGVGEFAEEGLRYSINDSKPTWALRAKALTNTKKSPEDKTVAPEDWPSHAEAPGYVPSLPEISDAKIAKLSKNLNSLEKDGKHFLVGVTLGFKRDGLEINSISGLSPNQDHEWIKWITVGKLLYVDKEKIQPILTQQRMTFADVEKIRLDLESAAKIVKASTKERA